MKLLFFTITFLLVACSEPTVKSACYDNGPHDSMSDDRIVRLCECVVRIVDGFGLDEEQRAWAIATLSGHSIANTQSSAKKQEILGVVDRVKAAHSRCLATVKAR